MVKHEGGSNVKVHVLATNGLNELRLVMVMKEDGGDQDVEVTVKGRIGVKNWSRSYFQINRLS